VADAFELAFDVSRGGDIAVGQMPEIQLHGRLVAPFERHLINPPRWLAAGLQGVVHGGEVVIGGVQMCAVVGADGAALDGRIFTAWKLVDPNPHKLRHGGGGLVVVDVFDLRQRVRRIALDPGLERRGDVDQATRHGAS